MCIRDRDHGDVELAAALLGRPFCVEGMVVHGRGLGRTIGFPTANLRCEKEQYLPASGVYAGYAEVDVYKRQIPA